VQPAVFLDRDNTLIHNDGDLGDPQGVRLIEGVAQGLKSLRTAGYQLVVVTNQGGVGRGRFSEDDVDAVHQRIASMVDSQAGDAGLIDRFYYCPYHPEATVAEYRRDHPWRKPNPGMLLQAARDMGLEMSHSWMIGDQERDVEAGRAAGCQTVLVTSDLELARRVHPTAVAADFQEAVQLILQHTPVLARSGTAAAHATGTGGLAGSSSSSWQEARTTPAAPSNGAAPHLHHHSNGEPGLGRTASVDIAGLRRAISDMTEELRSERMRRAEFTGFKMAAALVQLLALLMATLGLLQLASGDAFFKWMIGAALAQLLVMTLLVLDLKG
jgi:D-glycero-D-manno-heptose 1,7-bisphosphate phosphatase